MKYLESIRIKFPDIETSFTKDLFSLISPPGYHSGRILSFPRSNEDFFPKIYLENQSQEGDIVASFLFSTKEQLDVKIENNTGIIKRSPYNYLPLTIDVVTNRLHCSGVQLLAFDHIGFNLPWFKENLHPEIERLREILSPQCLYHRFPTGEYWDFILPGDILEITNLKNVDYTKTRTPKFELVTFTDASTALVQIDLGVNVNYETFSPLFPESINDPILKNIWIYLETPYPIDICLVINEYLNRDWSDYFKGYRI